MYPTPRWKGEKRESTRQLKMPNQEKRKGKSAKQEQNDKSTLSRKEGRPTGRPIVSQEKFPGTDYLPAPCRTP